MNEEPEPLPPVVTLVEPPPAAAPAPRKGWAKLSWVVILGFVGLIIGLRMVASPRETKEAPLAARIDLKGMQIHIQCIVALRRFDSIQDPRDLYESVASADGDAAKRLRISAFAAEMIGPKETLAQLDAAAQAAHLTADNARLVEILRRLYRDQQRGLFYHPSVNDADAQWLEEQLGWFGKLALFPSISEATLQEQAAHAGALGPMLLEQYRDGRKAMLDSALQTLIIVAAFAGAVLLVLLCGCIAVPVFLLLWMLGVVRVGLKPGIAHGGVYAETFALWLVFYSGLLIGGELLLHDAVPAVVRGVIAMPLSLLVILWPVLRGVPWRQVRQDIGWTAGRLPLLEPLCGWACYLVNVPLMIAGFLLTLGLAAGYAHLQHAEGGGEPAPPAHPVLEQFAHVDVTTLVLTFFLLSVVAPVVEETMFRGVLHRHLRESIFTRRPVLGGVCTALIVNVIFAAIHPQGLFFIPVLAALACGFSLAREWRGTLLPSMFAHGTHNFMQGVLAVLLLGQ